MNLCILLALFGIGIIIFAGFNRINNKLDRIGIIIFAGFNSINNELDRRTEK